MKLLIVRHGDPDYSIDSLTETGWIEAELLSDRLCKLDVKAFYCSPKGRARDTAKATLEKLGRQAEILPWLREFSPQVLRPGKDKPGVAWDWLPQDWTKDKGFYDREHWWENDRFTAAGVREEAQWVWDGLDELLARNDIGDVVGGYVPLTSKGGSYWGCCPFHNEKTPSFHVLQDKQFYHCFGCKKGGGVINFIMEIENLSYPDAIRFLARRVNLPVPEEENDGGTEKLRRRMLELNRDAARWYYQTLQGPEGAAVRAYLQKRQIRRGIAVRFGMGAAPDSWDSLLRAMTQKGYSKDELVRAGLVVQNKKGGLYDKFRNRLMLPVIDVRGDVVGFGSRVLDKSEPKYMNTTETLTYSKRRVLYGLNLAKKTKRPNIILCEGNLDVVTLHQAGFDNAVASMGTALTVEQTRLLSRYTKELVLCYDNDNAGRLATQRALEILRANGEDAYVIGEITEGEEKVVLC